MTSDDPAAGRPSLPTSGAPGPGGPAWPTGSAAPPTARARTNGFAIAALVLGIVWLLGLGSVLAVIFGHLALTQIARSDGWEKGRGMALAGLILGYCGLALLLFGVIVSATTSPS